MSVFSNPLRNTLVIGLLLGTTHGILSATCEKLFSQSLARVMIEQILASQFVSADPHTVPVRLIILTVQCGVVMPMLGVGLALLWAMAQSLPERVKNQSVQIQSYTLLATITIGSYFAVTTMLDSVDLLAGRIAICTAWLASCLASENDEASARR